LPGKGLLRYVPAAARHHLEQLTLAFVDGA